MIQVAFMIAMALASIAMQAAGKAKGDEEQDPVVGKRYWSDNILAYAAYSKRTAMLWCGNIFLNNESTYGVFYAPKANDWGETIDIYEIAEVDQGVVPGFTVPNPGVISNNWWDSFDPLEHACVIPEFTLVDKQNPNYQTHNLGVFWLAIDQGFMGLNAATVSNYEAIVSVYPGVVYNLMSQGDDYNIEDLWVRWRRTMDCGMTINVNPVVIVLDLLLDVYEPEEIDFLSIAYAGKKLLENHPYMWFSKTITTGKISKVIEEICNVAMLTVRFSDTGLIQVHYRCESPDKDIQYIRTIDVLDDNVSITLEKPALTSAEIINEIRSTFLAARLEEEQLISTSDATNPEVAALELEIVDITEKYKLARKNFLYVNSFHDYTQPETDPTNPDYAFTKTTWTEYRKIMLDLYNLYKDAKKRLDTLLGTDTDDHGEGQFLEYGVNVVDPANIILTGRRKQLTLDLSFLNWLDDARRYSEDALLRKAKPLTTGEFETTYKYHDLHPGDLIRVDLADDDTDLVYRFIVDIQKKELGGYPDEKLTFEFIQSAKWYDIIIGEPNRPADIIPKPKIPDIPSPLDKSYWAIMVCMSTLARGMPMITMNIHQTSTAIDLVKHWEVDDCESGEKVDENLLMQHAHNFSVLGVIQHDIKYYHQSPGMNELMDLTFDIPLLDGVNAVTMGNILSSKFESFAGTKDLFFSEINKFKNYCVMSKAYWLEYDSRDYGEGVIMRFLHAEVLVEEGSDDELGSVTLILKGVYSDDMDNHMLDFTEGSIAVIMPKLTDSTAYGIETTPLQAKKGETMEMIGRKYTIKTEPYLNGVPIAWSDCYCTIYVPSDYWMFATEGVVSIRNNDYPEASHFYTETIFADSSDNMLDIWVDVPDYDISGLNDEAMNIPFLRLGQGPTPHTLFSSAPVINDSAVSTAGLVFTEVSLVIYKNGVQSETRMLDENKLYLRCPISELEPSFAPGDIIQINAIIENSFKESYLMENNTTINRIECNGPKIIAV